MKKEYIYAAISIFLWSTTATVSKLLLGSIESMQIMLMSSLIATVVLLFVNLAKGTLSEIRKLKLSDFCELFVIGTLGTFLYHLLLYTGIDRMDASQAFIINYLWPIMSVFFGCIILKEKLTARRVIAILLSFVGVVVVTTNGKLLTVNENTLSGAIFCVLAAVSFGLYTILNKRKNYNQFISALIFNLASTVISVVYAIITKMSLEFTAVEIGGFLWIGIFTTAFPILIWALALQSGETAKVSNLAYITPVLSLVWTTLILRETFKISSVIGLAIILLGVFIQLKKEN